MKYVSLFLLCGLCAYPQAGTGVVSGTVVDSTGATISGAKLILSCGDQSPAREVLSGSDGRFLFNDVASGPFHLAVLNAGFAPQTVSGDAIAGGTVTVPEIALKVAMLETNVNVTVTQAEIAEEQIRAEEKQRVLGIVPNYYVNYDQNAAPLTPKQKFQLTWKFVVDPVSFGITGAIAAVQQARNDFRDFGQGTAGYAKRYGASYADFVSGSFISSAILPVLLKQDPRYFYRGTGSKGSRILYAISTAVIRKGDNGHWQPNYSDILGSLASGGISNLYYPAKDRNGAGLTLENALIGIAGTAGGNLIEEFLSRRLTPSVHHKKPADEAPVVTGR